MELIKKIIFVLVLMFFFQPDESHAQSKSTSTESSFKVLKTAGISDLTAYEKAVNVPDIENFRYKTKRNTIVFDNGITIELLSAQELFIMGKSVQPNDYSDTRDKKYIQPIFHLAENGSLVAMYTKVLK
jgi:hypothetical protein